MLHSLQRQLVSRNIRIVSRRAALEEKFVSQTIFDTLYLMYVPVLFVLVSRQNSSTHFHKLQIMAPVHSFHVQKV